MTDPSHRCTTYIALAATVAALFLSARAAADGSFTPLPGVTPSGVSADGSVVAGTSASEYFVWTSGTGVVLIGGTAAGAGVGGQAKVSDDGEYVCGTWFNSVSGFHEMSRYSVSAGAWTALGGIGGSSGTEISSGWGISGDGLSVVGLGWISGGGAHATQWDQGGAPFDLGSTVPGSSSRANAVDFDGNVVAGWQDSSSGFRQGAVWTDGVQDLIWYDAAQTQRAGECSDTSETGFWVVGSGVASNGWQAWRRRTGVAAQSLGAWSPADWRGASVATTADGMTVVGFYRPFGAPAIFGQGFIWTQADGLQELNAFAAAQGIDTQGVTLALPLDISADGSTIVGAGFGNGSPGWVLRLDCPADCPGDTNGDNVIDVDDIVNVVLDFGSSGDGNGDGNNGDVDGSGTVDVDDIVFVVLNFGNVCP